jgi:hypothetical protein
VYYLVTFGIVATVGCFCLLAAVSAVVTFHVKMAPFIYSIPLCNGLAPSCPHPVVIFGLTNHVVD